MKTFFKQRLLHVVFVVIVSSLYTLGVEPSTDSVKTDWNVRWQFQPGTELIFEAIDQTTSYCEQLRNNKVTGESQTTLQPMLEFVPSPNSITFRLKTNGVSLTPTKSTSRIATIFCDSEQTFCSLLQYDFGSTCWRQTRSTVSGNLVNRNIRVVLNSGCFANIKLHLIMAGFEESAKILQNRGLNKLQNQIHAEMATNLNDLLRSVKNGIRLDDTQRLPVTRFVCHSDHGGARGTFCLGTPAESTAAFPDSANRLFGDFPAVLAFDQSVFHRWMQARFGGKTVPLNKMPEWMFSETSDVIPVDEAETPSETSNDAEQADDDKMCYATLNAENPMELLVANGTVTLVIHADAFEQAQRTYPGMDITVTYKIPPEDFSGDRDMPLLLRDGEVIVTPKSEPQRNLRAVTIRRWLLNFFERDLPKQISCDEPSFAGKDDQIWKIGQFRLVPEKIALDDGWFAVACQLIPECSP